jgi:hypothetical protein
MKCAEIQGRIVAFLDRELDDAGQAEVLRHLSACTECQEVADGEQALTDVYRSSLSEASMSDLLEARIRASLEDAESEEDHHALSSPDAGNWRWLPFAAGILVSVVVYLLIASQPGPVQPATARMDAILSQHALFALADDSVELETADLNEIKSFFSGKVLFDVCLHDLGDYRTVGAHVRAAAGGEAWTLHRGSTTTVSHVVLKADVEDLGVESGPGTCDWKNFRFARITSHGRNYGVLSARHGDTVCIFIADLDEQEIEHIIDQVLASAHH